MQGIVEHETRALVLLSNDNGLLQDAELAWDVRGSPLRSFPWQVHASQDMQPTPVWCYFEWQIYFLTNRWTPAYANALAYRHVGVLQDQSALLQRFFEHATMPDQGWRILRGGSGSTDKAQGTAGERADAPMSTQNLGNKLGNPTTVATMPECLWISIRLQPGMMQGYRHADCFHLST